MDPRQLGAANNEWGHYAEALAVEYILRKGFTIRERNWRLGRSEIDIIAQAGDTIIFIEVKARKGDFQSPLEAIDKNKRRLIIRGANAYLNSLERIFYYRFDVVTITGTPEYYTLEHIEDAFLPPVNSRY